MQQDYDALAQGVPEEVDDKEIILEETKDRMSFIRKVYGILTVQLALTAGTIALVQLDKKVRFYAIANVWLSILAISHTVLTTSGEMR